MNTRGAWWLGMVAALGIGGLILAGCETTETVDSALEVSPPSADVSGVGTTVAFTVSASGTNGSLALPLVWSVSDTSLGIIKTSAGLTAIYESTGKIGNNAITVRDQGEAEGVAIVNQR